MIQIYGLTDPRNDTVRYIGASKDAAKRYRSHVSAPSPTVKDWFDELKSLGINPLLAVLEEVDDADARHIEYEWIFFFQMTTGDVLNRRTMMPNVLMSKKIDWRQHQDALTFVPRFSLENLERTLIKLKQEAIRLDNAARAIEAQQATLAAQIEELKRNYDPHVVHEIYRRYFFI